MSTFVCEIDGKQFNNKSCNNHKKLHGGIFFNCDQCPQVFSTKRNLTSHKTRDFHAGSILSCEQCEESFSTNTNLKRHVMSKHEKQKFSCASCGNEFARKDNLKKHYIQCKKTTNDKVVQETIEDLELIEAIVEGQSNNNNTIEMPNNYENEFLKFNINQDEICNACEKSFINKNSLKVHKSNEHAHVTKRQCMCCRNLFSSVSNLKKHMKSSHPEFLQFNVVINEQPNVNIENSGIIPTWTFLQVQQDRTKVRKFALYI